MSSDSIGPRPGGSALLNAPNLLSLSRVEMRVHLPPRGIVELNESAAYVCQSLEPVAAGAKITLTLKRDDAAARIRGDREEIVQVMQNLIQNAIKYGREGGKIDVEVGRDPGRGANGGRVWISVREATFFKPCPMPPTK